jgi:choline dehydrogenase-like flavoprotein
MDYDFIIAGGGSARSVLAARLSENPAVRVLLLEAGGTDRHPFYHMPAGFAKMTKGIGSWGWQTVPQRHMQNMVIRYTQAKVIGGGSTINAQIYTRGNALDYDEWRQMGCEGSCPISARPRTTTASTTAGTARAALWASANPRRPCRSARPISPPRASWASPATPT